MSVETFYTIQSAQAGKTAKTGNAFANGSQGAANSALGGNGSFFDMFLSNALQALEESKAVKADKTSKDTAEVKAGGTPSVEGTLPNGEIITNEAQALAVEDETPLDQELAMNINSLAGGETSEGEPLSNEAEGTASDILALNSEVFDETGAPIVTEIAASQDNGDGDGSIDGNIDTTTTEGEDIPTILNALDIGESSEDAFVPGLSKFEKMLAKIEKLIAEESPALSALNITPEQINVLKNQIAQIKSGEQPETNEELGGLMIGLVKMLPPQAKPMMVVTGQSLVMSPKQLEVLQSGQNTGTVAPSNDQGGTANAPSTLAPVNTEGELIFFDGETPNTEGDFEQLLKAFTKGGKDNVAAKAENIAGKAQSENAGPPAHILQGWPFGNSGSLFAPMQYSTSQYDEMGLSTNGQTSLTSATTTLTSLVTQGGNATHAHPATQMVAASMQKAAAGGEAKNIRIELDPPELGRVEIKMSFNKDKTMKAVLTAEKPETFMMLQRDAQVLERALQEAGLDVSAEGSLSFELADDGNFGQDGGHDGSRNETANGDAAEGEEEIIETTMTYHVDPETGHMRYNILA